MVLARILDKGRAELAGTAGEYKYNNPGDYHWFRFTGITPEALKAELATGKGDGEMLAWIEQNAPHKRTPWEIHQWSAYFNERGPDGDVETLEFFAERAGEFSKKREDVKTWFDLLDLDDHVPSAGKRRRYRRHELEYVCSWNRSCCQLSFADGACRRELGRPSRMAGTCMARLWPSWALRGPGYFRCWRLAN